jgi:hypothetical protein
VIINPEIQSWFDKSQGQPQGAGGSAPIVPMQNFGLQTLAGIVKPQEAPAFQAPQIDASRFQPTPIQQPQQRSPIGAPMTPVSTAGAGATNYGGSAMAAGLQAAGRAIEQSVEALAERRKQAAAIAAQANALNLPDWTPHVGIGSGSSSVSGTSAPSFGLPSFARPGVSPSSGAGVGVGAGSPENVKTVYDTLINSGATPQGAQGIIASTMGESGKGLDPKLENNSGTEHPGALNPNGSYGIAQWNGPRQAGLQKFAQQMGLDPSDINAQAGYMVHEMQNDYAPTWKAATDPNATAQSVLATHVANYESPAHPQAQILNRIKYLQNVPSFGQQAMNNPLASALSQQSSQIDPVKLAMALQQGGQNGFI